MEEIQLDIPRISGDPIKLTVGSGDQLFIVGANGSGKSALIQHFVSKIGSDKIKRISAHRQTWMSSGSTDFTPSNRQQYEKDSQGYKTQYEARWRDSYGQRELSAILFDLIAKENARVRAVIRHLDNEEEERAKDILAKSTSPLKQINELLALGTLTVKLETSGDESLTARHLRGEPFSIAEMSDGERNAMIIASHVITADPGTVLLIDEPERHLHRSITQPFLSAMFDLRTDCTFIVSTHEIALPIAKPEARVLMLRLCQWSGNRSTAWDAEALESDSQLPEELRLPEELKLAILGSRKRILFVEGDSNSLDFPLYKTLFPDLSVIPKGSCEEVQKAVHGLGESHNLHHVEAFGLIDRDNRKHKEVEKLAESNIFALEVHSVEALYYCSEAITAVAHQQAKFWEDDADELIADGLIESAKQKAIEILKDQDLAARMASRRCERKVRELFLSKIPDWKSIMTTPTQSISVSVDPQLYYEELKCYNKFVDDGRLDKLTARYPLRDSQVFETIVKTLRCENQQYYERMVIKLVRDDQKVAKCLKKHIGPLSEILDQSRNPKIT